MCLLWISQGIKKRKIFSLSCMSLGKQNASHSGHKKSTRPASIITLRAIGRVKFSCPVSYRQNLFYSGLNKCSKLELVVFHFIVILTGPNISGLYDRVG